MEYGNVASQWALIMKFMSLDLVYSLMATKIGLRCLQQQSVSLILKKLPIDQRNDLSRYIQLGHPSSLWPVHISDKYIGLALQ